MPTNEDLTVKELASAIKLHPNTVRAMIKTGQIEAYLLGRNYRIPLASLDKIRSKPA